ncbi:MAG: hypothetical protein Q8P50_06950 [Bacillota bacterium]|nr:hypothetical protein [Bacillota bacterium]
MTGSYARSGVAAQIATLEELRTLGHLDAADILAAFTCDEAVLSEGTIAFLHSGYCAHAALLSEPFFSPVIIGSPAKVHLRVTVLDEPSHGGTPDEVSTRYLRPRNCWCSSPGLNCWSTPVSEASPTSP